MLASVEKGRICVIVGFFSAVFGALDDTQFCCVLSRAGGWR